MEQAGLGATIWKTGCGCCRLGIDTHLITAHFALPLMIEQPGGLLVEVTDGTADYNADHYRLSPFYDLAKTAVNRMAWAHAKDLEKHGATAVSLTPGWLRSEMMLEIFGVREENWRDATATVPHFVISETPALRRPRGRGAGRRPRARRAGTGSRCRAAGWRRSMGSPISTARGRMPGGIWSRCRKPESRPTIPAIAKGAAAGALDCRSRVGDTVRA